MPNSVAMAGQRTTLDPGINIFSAAEIRVVVMPLGVVPRDVLDEYLQLMQRFRTMSLSAVRSFYQHSSDKTPFQSLDWGAGAVHFRFMQVEEARRKSRLLELHPSRQVVAVLGIMHCPVTPSVAPMYQDFQRACKEQFPEARVTRCFVFEPSEDHIRQDNQQHIPGLVMFPPTGGQAHLEQHLEVWMHDLAALVLAELEKWVLDATPRSMPRSSSSFTDSSEFIGSVTVMEEMAKRLSLPDDEVREKRRRGRLHKVQGDVCLMAGSPRDALNNYRVAQELSKATNDWVWCGAALEGCAHARVLEVPRGSQGLLPGASSSGAAAAAAASSSSGDVGRSNVHGSSIWPSWEVLRSRGMETEVRELLAEAKTCYKKKGGVLAMQVENSLKLGRMLAGLHGRTARREVSELGSALLDAVSGLHFMEDRLLALAEAAQMYGLVGAVRKRQLLLWLAADPTRNTDKAEVLRLAIQAAEPPDDPAQQDSVHDSMSHLHWTLQQPGIPPQLWQRSLTSSGTGTSASGSGTGTSTQGSGTKAATSAASPPAPTPSLLPPPALLLPPSHWVLCGAVWNSIQAAVQELVLLAARQCNSPADAWEATSGMLRHNLSCMPSGSHASFLEGLAAAAAAMPPKLRSRPGLGPPLPLVHLKRVPPLPPQHLPQRMPGLLCQASGSDGGGVDGGILRTSSNPFIFNPNADKRRGMEQKKQGRRQAVLSAAEPVMAAEWVCGEEGRVELELINPLAAAVKIDSISLYARYAPAYPAPAGASGTPGTPEQQQQQQQAGSSRWRSQPIQLLLPPNGKPVKVQLKGTALLPGTLNLSGVRVSALGAWWFEPFGSHLPQPSAGLGNGLGLGSTGNLRAMQYKLSQSSTGAAAGASRWRQVQVTVLPPLPLLQAVLKRRDCRRGAEPDEVLAASPFPDDPVAGAAAAAPGAAPPPAIPRAPSQASLQPRRTVSVWQGQRCSWELHLTNVGGAAVSSVQLAVANQRGVLLKPLPQGHVRASFTGVHLEVGPRGAACLAAGLPLEPGRTLVVPMEMHAGQPPGDAYEELVLEVRIAYTGPSTDPSSPSGPSKELLGRHLILPVQLQVQRTVQVTALQFLDLMLPVKDGVRCCSGSRHAQQDLGSLHDLTPPARSMSYTLSPRSKLGKQASGLRDHFGLLGADMKPAESSGMLTLWSQEVPSFSRRSEPQMLWKQQEDAEIDLGLGLGPGLGSAPSSNSLSAGARASAAAATSDSRPPCAAAAATPATTMLALESECLLEVSVVSASERYLRVWLERVPAPGAGAGPGSGREAGGSEPSSSESCVLPPGELSTLRCSVSARGGQSQGVAAAEAEPGAGGGGGGAALLPGCEPDRMAAAEALCSSWAVAWRMIAPGEEESNAPCGIVQLAAVEVARSLTPRAISCLQPSQLSFCISALYTVPVNGAAAGSSTRPRVQELTRRMQDLDIGGGGPPAETWGLRLGLGEVLELQVQVSSSSPASQLLQFSLGASNLACLPDRATDLQDPATQHMGMGLGTFGGSAAGCGVDSGVLLMGQIEKVRCRVGGPSSVHVHRMSVMFVQPGLYQLYVHDVVAVQQGEQGSAAQSNDWAGASRVYANVQQLNVICL